MKRSDGPLIGHKDQGQEPRVPDKIKLPGVGMTATGGQKDLECSPAAKADNGWQLLLLAMGV